MQKVLNGVPVAKRVYARPQLEVLGSVLELTQQAGSPPGRKTGTLHDGNGWAPWVKGSPSPSGPQQV